MNPLDQKTLVASVAMISCQIKDRNAIIDYLLEKGVLNEEKLAKINKGSSESEKNRRLVHLLQTSGGPSAFRDLLDALKHSNQDRVASMILAHREKVARNRSQSPNANKSPYPYTFTTQPQQSGL